MAIFMLEFIFFIVTSIFCFYYYLIRKFDFWKNRGVKGPKPIPFFGTISEVMRVKVSLGCYLANIYRDNKDEKMIGIFEGSKPALILRDLDLIKDVLIKDFAVFPDRAVLYHEKIEPLSQHIFALKFPEWRPLRTKLSPAFTTSKLKNMLNSMVECTEQLERYLEVLAKKGEPIDCRDLASRYVTDVVAFCFYGLHVKAMVNKENEFYRIARRIFRHDLKIYLRGYIFEIPWLYNIVGRLLSDKDVEEFFTRLTLDSIDYRKRNNIHRDDIINILIEMNDQKKIENIDITKNILVSNGIVFFAGAFETSSITMVNSLYELALNHTIQDKLRREIKEVLESTEGTITYESMKKMEYLDSFVREILRKYSPVTYLVRRSLRDYNFRGTDVTIPKETKVYIPVYGIQTDPDIYPKPEVFDPDRFTEERVKSRHPMTYIPFGDGPRQCIGMRFGDYLTKIGLIKILQNYLVDVCEKTPPPPYPINKGNFMVLLPACTIYVKLSPISTF